jgi:hypothetical protein
MDEEGKRWKVEGGRRKEEGVQSTIDHGIHFNLDLGISEP